MAGTHVADARPDFRDGEVCLGKERLGARGAESGEVGVRRRAGQLFEEAREVEGREVSRGGDLFEREIAVHVRVHQLDGEAYAAVYEAGAREFEVCRAAKVGVAAQEMDERLLDERADDKPLPGRLLAQLVREVAPEPREAFVAADFACAEGDDKVGAREPGARGTVGDEDRRELEQDILGAARVARRAQLVAGRGQQSLAGQKLAGLFRSAIDQRRRPAVSRSAA